MTISRNTRPPTPRDLDILREIHSFRLLRSRDHILPLFGGSTRILRRLQFLTAEDYLYALDGRRRHQQAIYAVGNGGLRLLKKEDKIPLPKTLRQSEQNRKLTGEGDPGFEPYETRFIRHTLDIADVIVAIRLACRISEDVRFISQAEIIAGAPQKTRAEARKLRGRPLYLETDLRYEGTWNRCGTEPDRLFGLHLTSQPEDRAYRYFFLEADRGNETVITPNLGKASIIRKMLVYWHSWNHGGKSGPSLYREQFGLFHIRTLFIVSGRYSSGTHRVDSFLKANKLAANSHGSRLFLFIEKDRFLAGDNSLNAPLLNGRGEYTSLIE